VQICMSSVYLWNYQCMCICVYNMHVKYIECVCMQLSTCTSFGTESVRIEQSLSKVCIQVFAGGVEAYLSHWVGTYESVNIYIEVGLQEVCVQWFLRTRYMCIRFYILIDSYIHTQNIWKNTVDTWIHNFKYWCIQTYTLKHTRPVYMYP